MISPRFLFASLLLALVSASGPSRAENLADQARAAMTRATQYLRSISTGGGYVGRYSPDLKRRFGEDVATETQIWIEPPGTPAVGAAFIRAYSVTRDPRYLHAARAAAIALVRGQLQSGGWPQLVELDKAKRARWAYRVDGGLQPGDHNQSTYDDNKTQSALRFLMAFADVARSAPDPQDSQVRESVDYGLKKLAEAQYPNGGWPQAWDGRPHDATARPVVKASFPKSYPREQPHNNYKSHYTLNDATQSDVIRTFLDAYRRTGRSEYLRAAKRGGDFLLLAQMPAPQPVWAQQYDAAMHPAWARAFEPPSVTSNESADVIELLLDLFLATGDERYTEPLPAAIDWFKRSAVSPGVWARLYELETNRPIYGDRDKKIHYTLEEVSEERRRGYAWLDAFTIPQTLERAEAVLATGRLNWLARQQPAWRSAADRAARAAELEPKVRSIVAALDEKNRWVSPLSKTYRGNVGPWIETSTFNDNLGVLCDYLAATSL